jgi:hypothetical protein
MQRRHDDAPHRACPRACQAYLLAGSWATSGTGFRWVRGFRGAHFVLGASTHTATPVAEELLVPWS